MKQIRSFNHYITGKAVHRFVSLLFVIVLSATSGIVLHANAMNSNETGSVESTVAVEVTDTDKVYKKLCVEPGDTLWAIAKKYGDPNKDVRSYIREIKDVNQLKTSNLQVGQVLLLP